MRSLLLVLPLTLACGGEAPRPAHPHQVATRPPPGVVRFLVGGDSRQDGSHVLPWALDEAKARGASAFLFLGDMELTPSFDAHFREQLGALAPIPFYPVLGNHEVKLLGIFGIGQNHAEKEFREHFLGTPSTPVRSSLAGKVVYSANLPGGVHFVALDNVSQKGFGADQLAWLAADLEQARFDPDVRHVFVGMHKPLAHNKITTHSMDSDGPDAIADSEAALVLFERAHVDLVLESHVHEFARYQQGGIRCYITGGLGAPLVHADPEHAFHHVLEIDVHDRGEVDVDVVRFDGAPTFETDQVTEDDLND
jgi:hypothetical protein